MAVGPWLMRNVATVESGTAVPVGVVTFSISSVSRLERALDGFEAERENQEVRLADAERRIASYRTRVGVEFALGAELAEKRARLAEIDADLKRSTDRIKAMIEGLSA